MLVEFSYPSILQKTCLEESNSSRGDERCTASVVYHVSNKPRDSATETVAIAARVTITVNAS